MKKKVIGIFILLGISGILYADLSNKIQNIESLVQQGKYDQAELEARNLIGDSRIVPAERAAIQSLLVEISKKKSSQQSTEPANTNTITESDNVNVTVTDQNGVAIVPGPQVVDSGTIPVTNRDDVSDGSKFKTYDTYEKAILSSSSPSANSIYGLCNLYFKDGLYERAVTLAKTDRTGDIRNLFVVAIGSRLIGDNDVSIEYYNRILSKSPNNLEANLGIGVAYKQKGDFKNAISYLQKYANQTSDPEVRRDIRVLTDAINNM